MWVCLPRPLPGSGTAEPRAVRRWRDDAALCVGEEEADAAVEMIEDEARFPAASSPSSCSLLRVFSPAMRFQSSRIQGRASLSLPLPLSV